MRPVIFDILNWGLAVGQASCLSSSPSSPAWPAANRQAGRVMHPVSAPRPQTPNPRPHFSRQPDRIRATQPWCSLIRATNKRRLNFPSRTRLCQPSCFGNQQPNASHRPTRSDSDYSGLGRATKKKKGPMTPDTPSHASRITHHASGNQTGRILKSERINKSAKDHSLGGRMRRAK